jgi:hypothetical protein
VTLLLALPMERVSSSWTCLGSEDIDQHSLNTTTRQRNNSISCLWGLRQLALAASIHCLERSTVWTRPAALTLAHWRCPHLSLPTAAVMLMSLRAQLQAPQGNTRPIIAAQLNADNLHDSSKCNVLLWVPRSNGTQFLAGHASGNIVVYKKVRSCCCLTNRLWCAVYTRPVRRGWQRASFSTRSGFGHMCVGTHAARLGPSSCLCTVCCPLAPQMRVYCSVLRRVVVPPHCRRLP